VTYSIVARDPATGELGIAVQSRRFAAGAGVPHVRAGVGVVAMQAFMPGGYGRRALELMAAGGAPEAVLAELVARDDHQDLRQVALLAADGRTAVHVGAACVPEAHGIAAGNVSVQGNMLSSADVVTAMAEEFARAAGTLAERLLAALDAAEAAGGDFRGREAAGLVVVAGTAGDDPWDDLVVDIRVDNHADPLGELRRLQRIAAGYRRLSRIGADAAAEEEVEAARAAGLPESDVVLAGAIADAQSGDVDAAARRLAPLVAADARWRDVVARATRLGQLPHAVLERLGR
jgi:uncharacterized Ntn-hydrolase superfamily protein